MSGPLFALIDGNTFYASCEKVFRPDLVHTPTVVLSNNDGCVVTRSSEAKRLGIRRGTPFFKIREMARAEGVAVFSSNYELYQSLSNRMMGTIATLCPRIEPYSIDECFADLSGLEQSASEIGSLIRSRVRQWVGIAVCVGIGPTKTLAKLANHLAKEYPALGGVLNWNELAPQRRMKALSIVPVGEIWGIGGRIGARLKQAGVATALDFSRLDRHWVRSRFGVTLERTLQEINAVSCLPFEAERPRPASICRSRSFAAETDDLGALLTAVSVHVAEAAKKLREGRQCARSVSVFLLTNRFKPEQHQCALADTMPLAEPTADSLELTRVACGMVRSLHRPGILIKKAGIVLEEIVPEGKGIERDLFSAERDAQRARRSRLMATLDSLEERFGAGIIGTAGTHLSGGWKMRRDLLSPCYTTRIEDVAVVG
ncbi:MAG TPA: hypothetical protein DEO49_02860 [Sutterella sp.]|nr:hypothetical protein [Sutterella sp.]